MKIVVLSGAPLPSTTAESVHIIKQCYSFACAGHDVTLIARGTSCKIAADEIATQYGVRNNFHISLVRNSRLGGLSSAAFAIRTMMRAMYIRKPDLYYSRYSHSLATLIWRGVPLVLESHLPPLSWFQRSAHRWLFRSKYFDRLVVISEALGKEYTRLFPDLSLDRVVLAREAADDPLKASNCSTQPLLPSGTDMNVGYIGSLYPGKGMELIVAIASRLPNTQFHVVGGSTEEVNSWKKKCQALNVFFHGHVDHAQIGRYLESFDLVLAPYQRCVQVAGGGDASRWMSPMKLFEYMAYGKAIVCSDLPVLREFLTDNVNTIFADPDDADTWVEAIRSLSEEPDSRLFLGGNARNLFETNYTWAKRTETVLAGL